MENMESVSLSDGGGDEEEATEEPTHDYSSLDLVQIDNLEESSGLETKVPSETKAEDIMSSDLVQNSSPVLEVQQQPEKDQVGTAEEVNVVLTEETTEKSSVDKLEEEVIRLETQRGQLASEVMVKDNTIAQLEVEGSRLKGQIDRLEALAKANEEAFTSKITAMNEEMASKISNLNKALMGANREKESMVMKFAMREKDILVSQRKAEEADKRMKMAVKERDDAAAKMKTAVADKVKFQAVADSRLQDVCNLRKDVDRWKEEVKIQEAKAASHNSRLRAEVEAHCDTREQLDKTIKHLAETRAEIDRTRKECQEFMDKMRSEESEAKRQEEEQAREQKTKLIIDQAAATELSELKERHSKLTEEHAASIVKTEKLEAAKEADAAALAGLRETVASQKQEIVDLYSQVAELESIRLKLASQNDHNEDLKNQVLQLQSDVSERDTTGSALRQREAELLDFTQKLTETNANLQSDLSSLRLKSDAAQGEQQALTGALDDLETRLAEATGQLEAEKRTRVQETELLARKLAEKSKQADSLYQKSLDAENEVQVLKRKHASSLKELTRELQKSHHMGPSTSGANGVMRKSSRSSSSTSINHRSSPEDLQDHSQLNSLHLSDTSSSRSNVSVSAVPAPPQQEIQVSLTVPPDQALVEKMIRLQRTLARKQEKIEFMEEHSTTLLEDIKKKNRLIQNYILNKETPGALTSSKMDQNKRMLSEHGGGIMSSLYSSKPNDTGMTLELSLEINQKLQAVLEDTLLKNITLKENIDTLGNEIANMATRGAT